MLWLYIRGSTDESRCYGYTLEPGKSSPATSRPGFPGIVAGENGKCCSGYLLPNPMFNLEKRVLDSDVRTVNGIFLRAAPKCVSSERFNNLNINSPLISPHDDWATWTALFTTAAFGIWSERTKIGRMISAALVSILLGLAASNMGIIPHEARAYSLVMEFLLPLTIPLMLFKADMRNVIKSTGQLLLAFLIGSVATMIGTLVAYLIVPMRSLGQDSWKIASALMASYIGGAINYVAVSEALAVSPSVIAAGVAADNVICAIYFMALFALGSKLPTEASPSTKGPANNVDSGSGDNAPVLQTATALAVSFAICKGATHVVRLLKCQGSTLPAITAIVVILATLLPRQIGYLAPAGDALSAISIQVCL
nr:ferric reduction oxidase 4 [Tanacetum cinerariifolium]